MRYVSGNIRFARSYPLASFGHVQNFKGTPPDKYVRWMNITGGLVCGLSCSHAVCPVLVHSASCRYPVCIPWCPFGLNCNQSTTGQETEFPKPVLLAHSVFVQRTFCPFLMWYIFVFSVIHPLHVCELTFLCLLLVLYVCALYDIGDNFHYRRNIFCCFLSVRCPLPSSVDLLTAP